MQSEFIIDTVPTSDPEVIANSFNDFFVNVVKNLAENIKSDIDPLKYIVNKYVHSIITIEVTEDKIFEYNFSNEKFCAWFYASFYNETMFQIIYQAIMSCTFTVYQTRGIP